LKYLLEFKADVNLKGYYEYTSLFVALKWGSKDAVILLLENKDTTLNMVIKNKNIFDLTEQFLTDKNLSIIKAPHYPEKQGQIQ